MVPDLGVSPSSDEQLHDGASMKTHCVMQGSVPLLEVIEEMLSSH